jgi:uncharacterized membrane protein YcaP (DUF421 family)
MVAGDGDQPSGIRSASIGLVTIPDLGSDLIGVAARTAIVYVVLVIAFRLLGKRAAGQLSATNLVVILIVANAVQNAMVGENTSLIGGLLAAGIILGLDIAVGMVGDRYQPLRDWLDGVPTMLVEDGRIIEENLLQEGVSMRALGIALRQNGLMTAEEARYVFLEPNGEISVIPGRNAPSGDAADASPLQRAVMDGEVPRSPAGRRRRRPGRFGGLVG